MATRRVNDPNPKPNRRRPATTPEARERQLISKSYDAAEKMIDSGNPPAQVVTHFLKMGSLREKIELEYKQEEMKLLKIKAEAIASQQKVEELMGEALEAFRAYSGNPSRADDIE